jgi:hypothetical protein
MTTALTCYLNTAASATLSSANQLTTSTTNGTTTTTRTTKLGSGVTGYGECVAQTTSSAWAASAGPITSLNPTGKGWFLDGSLLDGQDIVSGNWTVKVRHTLTAGTATVDIYARAWRYRSGVYTLIGTWSKTGVGLSTTLTSSNLTVASGVTMSFQAGDRLYVDQWLNVTANSSAGDILVTECSVSGGGNVNVEFVTPGYQPTPVVSTGNPAKFVHRRRVFYP